MEGLRDVLKRYFGYETFRPMQEEVIAHTMNGGDSLVLMPTGGGKSLCFQIPALMKEGMTVVVSPLISLMKDQVGSLKSNGIAAEALNSSNDEEVNRGIIERCINGSVKLLYISPERLVGGMIQLLQHANVSLFAIDEAHCISNWGHDFRPEYTKLGQLRDFFPGVPIMALTATADKVTKLDILTQLHIEHGNLFVGSFDRPNLSLDVKRGYSASEKLKSILELIRRHSRESGIIYCLARKTTEQLAEKLKKEGISVEVYHAGLSSQERNRVQDNFIADKTQVICATIAFGMGIDKSNVRFVVHYNLPQSIESYYQEIGRGGRDGLPCETLLFYNLQDIILLKHFATESGNQDVNKEKLRRIQEYAEAQVCRRRILLNYFGEVSSCDCGNCDVCHTPPQTFTGTVIVQKALSAILRTDESVGFTVLIDILRGNMSQEVVANKYTKLKTFGAGREIPQRDWNDYLLQMLQMGFIEIAYNEDRHIHVTSLGREVISGKRAVQLAVIKRESFTVEARHKRMREEHSKQLQEVKGSVDDTLINRLRSLRMRIAEENDWPAYVVMSDRSLISLATEQPVTLEAFGGIYGIGAYKRDTYGRKFIDVIKEYISEKGKEQPRTDAESVALSTKELSYMHQQKKEYANAYERWRAEEEVLLKNCLDDGMSIGEISRVLGRNEGGISSRIEKMGIKIQTPLQVEDMEWFEECEEELERLQQAKADIEENINSLRQQILQQMEQRKIDKMETKKYSISYHPAKTTLQFDKKMFMEENEELYSSYCTPKQREAMIVIKRNKE